MSHRTVAPLSFEEYNAARAEIVRACDPANLWAYNDTTFARLRALDETNVANYTLLALVKGLHERVLALETRIAAMEGK